VDAILGEKDPIVVDDGAGVAAVKDVQLLSNLSLNLLGRVNGNDLLSSPISMTRSSSIHGIVP
jgi:hypothetical protein